MREIKEKLFCYLKKQGMRKPNNKTILTIINYTFKIFFFVLWTDHFQNVNTQKQKYCKTLNI